MVQPSQSALRFQPVATISHSPSQPANQAMQSVLFALCGCNNGVNMFHIVNGHDSPQGIGGQLFHKRHGQAVFLFRDKLLKLRGPAKG